MNRLGIMESDCDQVRRSVTTVHSQKRGFRSRRTSGARRESSVPLYWPAGEGRFRDGTTERRRSLFGDLMFIYHDLRTLMFFQLVEVGAHLISLRPATPKAGDRSAVAGPPRLICQFGRVAVSLLCGS